MRHFDPSPRCKQPHSNRHQGREVRRQIRNERPFRQQVLPVRANIGREESRAVQRSETVLRNALEPDQDSQTQAAAGAHRDPVRGVAGGHPARSDEEVAQSSFQFHVRSLLPEGAGLPLRRPQLRGRPRLLVIVLLQSEPQLERPKAQVRNLCFLRNRQQQNLRKVLAGCLNVRQTVLPHGSLLPRRGAQEVVRLRFRRQEQPARADFFLREI